METTDAEGKVIPVWQRTPREETIGVRLKSDGDTVVHSVPNSGGLQLHVVQRPVAAEGFDNLLPAGTQSISIFLVNTRPPNNDQPDSAYVFQPEIEVHSVRGFVPRPNPRGSRATEWDDEVADLHYADAPEYATGHGVSADWRLTNSRCHQLNTAWIPSAEVEKTVTRDIEGVELSMDILGMLETGTAAETALGSLVVAYREWISERRKDVASLTGKRRETAEELLRFA
jgi:hypothetical protein